MEINIDNANIKRISTSKYRNTNISNLSQLYKGESYWVLSNQHYLKVISSPYMTYENGIDFKFILKTNKILNEESNLSENLMYFSERLIKKNIHDNIYSFEIDNLKVELIDINDSSVQKNLPDEFKSILRDINIDTII